jgi:hypothetical protein
MGNQCGGVERTVLRRKVLKGEVEGETLLGWPHICGLEGHFWSLHCVRALRRFCGRRGWEMGCFDTPLGVYESRMGCEA